jgi:hypothetical protein
VKTAIFTDDRHPPSRRAIAEKKPFLVRPRPGSTVLAVKWHWPHGIGEDHEASEHGDEGDFGRFAFGDETFVNGRSTGLCRLAVTATM